MALLLCAGLVLLASVQGKEALSLGALNVSYAGASSTPMGGLLVEVSQAGLDYVGAMARHAIPSLLVDLQIPALEGAGFSVSKLKIKEMAAPNISSAFVEGVGLYAELLFPEIMMMGKFSAGFLWTTKEGAFKGVVRNLKLDMLVTLERGPDGAPAIIVPNCVGFTDDVLLVFGGGMSAVLNTLRGFLESFLRQDLGLILCDLMKQTTKAVEAEMAQKPKPSETPASGEEFEPGLLCGQTRLRESEEMGPSDFSGDFLLTQQPRFTDTHLLIGMKGEILYRNQSSGLQLTSLPEASIPYGERMISFAVTEYIVNSFFQQAFNYKLGTISESLSVRDFPPMMQGPLDLVCWGCKIELRAGMPPSGTAPVARFTSSGVEMSVDGEFRVIVDGPFRKFDLFKANLRMQILARPFIKDNAIFARQLKLSSYSTQVQSVGLGGVLGEPIQEVLDAMVPRKIWPRLQKQLRVALRQRGLRLPIICGLRLRRTRLEYHSGVVLVDTDFQYNLQYFLAKIRPVINAPTPGE